jgi:hypothetical protein
MFTAIFDDVFNGKIDTWDYQWFLIRLLNGKAVIPCCNLVSNIGFSEDATHTINGNSPLANLLKGEVCFPLAEPKWLVEDRRRDKEWAEILVKKRTSLKSIVRKLFR